MSDVPTQAPQPPQPARPSLPTQPQRPMPAPQQPQPTVAPQAAPQATYQPPPMINYQAPAVGQPLPAHATYPAPGPQPMPTQPPPAAPKKRWSSLKVALVVILLFTTLMGGCSAWFYLSTKDEIAQANELLAAWQARDYEAAEAMISPNCDTAMFDDIENFFGTSRITAYKITGARITDGPVSYADGTVTFDGDDQRTISIGSDELGICSFSLGAKGETDS